MCCMIKLLVAVIAVHLAFLTWTQCKRCQRKSTALILCKKCIPPLFVPTDGDSGSTTAHTSQWKDETGWEWICPQQHKCSQHRFVHALGKCLNLGKKLGLYASSLHSANICAVSVLVFWGESTWTAQTVHRSNSGVWHKAEICSTPLGQPKVMWSFSSLENQLITFWR